MHVQFMHGFPAQLRRPVERSLIEDNSLSKTGYRASECGRHKRLGPGLRESLRGGLADSSATACDYDYPFIPVLHQAANPFRGFDRRTLYSQLYKSIVVPFWLSMVVWYSPLYLWCWCSATSSKLA